MHIRHEDHRIAERGQKRYLNLGIHLKVSSIILISRRLIYWWYHLYAWIELSAPTTALQYFWFFYSFFFSLFTHVHVKEKWNEENVSFTTSQWDTILGENNSPLFSIRSVKCYSVVRQAIKCYKRQMLTMSDTDHSKTRNPECKLIEPKRQSLLL